MIDDTGEISALEDLTARMFALDASDLDGLTELVAARARLVDRLSQRRDLDSGDALRLRATLESGDAIMARVREWRGAWQGELAETERGERYAAELQGMVTPAKLRVDVRG